MKLESWPRLIERQKAAIKVEIDKALEKIGVAVERRAKDMIGTYQDIWPNLAPATVAEKERLGYAPPDNPLLRTGDMRESISHEVRPPMTLAVGSPSEIAKWQELGTNTIPPRPFLGLGMFEAEALIKRKLGEALVKALSRRL